MSLLKHVHLSFATLTGLAAIASALLAAIPLILVLRPAEKPLYRVEASNHDVPLDGESTLTLVGFYKDGRPASTAGFNCAWSVPTGLALLGSADACTAKVRVTPALFLMGSATHPLIVSVSASDGSARPVVSQPAHLLAFNLDGPIIDVSDSPTPRTGSALDFHFKGDVAATVIGCSWQPRILIEAPDTCRTRLRSLSGVPLAGVQLRLDVLLQDAGGKTFLLAAEPLTVSGDREKPVITAVSPPALPLPPAPAVRAAERAPALAATPRKVVLGDEPALQTPRKVVLVDEPALHTPNRFGDSDGQLLGGENVVIVQPSRDGWTKVQSGDGTAGFVPSDTLGGASNAP